MRSMTFMNFHISSGAKDRSLISCKSPLDTTISISVSTLGFPNNYTEFKISHFPVFHRVKTKTDEAMMLSERQVITRKYPLMKIIMPE